MFQCRRILCLILTLLLLTGCQSRKTSSPAEPASTVTKDTVPTAEPETVPEETQPEPVFEDYVYRYEDERDLAWEEDVVFLGQLYLGETVVKGHPYLINRDFVVSDENGRITTQQFYDPALRKVFREELLALIEKIPELTDTQITFELQRIVALLRDAHSSVSVPYEEEYFPISTEPLFHLGKMDYYTVYLPQEHEQWMCAQLISINNVPLEEIIEKMSAYISAENHHWAAYQVTSLHRQNLVSCKAMLQVIGVMEEDSDTARFRLKAVDGQTVELELEALSLTTGEYHALPVANYTHFATANFSDCYYGAYNYWFSYFEKEKALYLRFYEMADEEEYRLHEFLHDVWEFLEEKEGTQKLIIDLRYNPGGYGEFTGYLLDFVLTQDLEKTCVLINEGSCSAAVIFPTLLQKRMEDAVIIGSAAGQPPNFFADQNSYMLDNHDIACSISFQYYMCDPDFTGDTLTPDIVVYLSLPDYVEGIDTVLEAALNY